MISVRFAYQPDKESSLGVPYWKCECWHVNDTDRHKCWRCARMRQPDAFKGLKATFFLGDFVIARHEVEASERQLYKLGAYLPLYLLGWPTAIEKFDEYC